MKQRHAARIEEVEDEPRSQTQQKGGKPFIFTKMENVNMTVDEMIARLKEFSDAGLGNLPVVVFSTKYDAHTIVCRPFLTHCYTSEGVTNEEVVEIDF